MNPRKNTSERVHFDHGYKLVFMLKIGCVTRVFLGTLSKFSKLFFVKNIVTEFIFSMFANLPVDKYTEYCISEISARSQVSTAL